MPFDRQRRIGGRGFGRSEYPDPTAGGWVIFPTRSIYHRPSLSTVRVVSLVDACQRRHYLALFNIIAKASVERHSVPSFSARSAERHLHGCVGGFLASEL